MSDLEYTQNGFWSRFIPNTKAGEEAYKEIIRITGDGAVWNNHLKQTLKQLRDSGYTVSKAKKPTQQEIDEILKEIENI